MEWRVVHMAYSPNENEKPAEANMVLIATELVPNMIIVMVSAAPTSDKAILLFDALLCPIEEVVFFIQAADMKRCAATAAKNAKPIIS